MKEKKDNATQEDKEKIQTLDTEIDKLDEDIGSHTEKDLVKQNIELTNKITQIQNAQNAAKQATYQIGTFSIYLLKSGTKKEDALKAENQLLLLEGSCFSIIQK
ncbi:hypothetical protein AGMMS50229_20820 [Campylobacterota bacterium]|nr:hypothetical protein AGMMS50229_20820 [Campylobacterota bacterium]